MKVIENEKLVGERILFSSKDIELNNCSFSGGESPIKECDNIKADKLENFCRYPFWYSNDVEITNSLFHEDSRAALWYTNHVLYENNVIEAPKAFRRCSDVEINGSKFYNSNELLWACNYIKISDTYVEGDYLLMNSNNVEIDNLELHGKYSFDGVVGLNIKNSKLITKDAFWNASNVIVEDTYIEAEYIGWNAKNLTFKNCTIKSHQGLCYIDGLKLIDCKIIDSDLIFEYSTVKGNIEIENSSIKNPSECNLKVTGNYELILDKEDKKVNIKKIKINK